MASGDRDAGSTGSQSNGRERFIPVTRFALAERLSQDGPWGGAEDELRRFFRYLDYWRQQRYAALLLELERAYEAFSPDTDLLVTRKFGAAEQEALKNTVIGHVTALLQQANFSPIDRRRVEFILTPESHYGLNLDVDLDAFDLLLIYYRGLGTRTEQRRTLRKLYLRPEPFETEVYQRLFLLFKLKPVERQVEEVMAADACDRSKAQRKVALGRATLPPHITTDHIFLKLFKDVPRSDIEMCFPNTRLRLRLFEKLTLGASASGGLGMGVAGTATNVALATNPFVLVGTIAGLVGVAMRQLVKFINRRQRYMATMAQNLYFHAMGDNRAAVALLADLAAEQDVKEDMLLYSALATGAVHRRDLGRVDGDIERYLSETFGVTANFEIEDALPRLVADGIVTELPSGRLQALPPNEAARQIDALWDVYLDNLATPRPEGRVHAGGNGR
jgi:hypothetical protein